MRLSPIKLLSLHMTSTQTLLNNMNDSKLVSFATELGLDASMGTRMGLLERIHRHLKKENLLKSDNDQKKKKRKKRKVKTTLQEKDEVFPLIFNLGNGGRIK